MNKDSITKNQYVFIIIGNMIGIGIAFLGSTGTNIAHQNAWISTCICGIYPIIIVITAYIIDKKSNHDDFWIILKKVYGKVIAFIILFIFLIYYLIAMTGIVTGFASNLTQTISSYLNPYHIIVSCLVISALITMRGLQIVGRISEFYFYFTIVFILLLLFIIPKGSLINIQPVFDSYEDIASGIFENLVQYSSVEISFIIIGKISNNKKVLKAGIVACLITTLIYTFVSFIVIYYLGWELASRIDFPLFYIIGTISFPIISNLTSIFTFLWGIIVLKTLICSNYFICYCLANLFSLSYKISSIISVSLVFMYSFFMISIHNRMDILNAYIKYFIGFAIIFGLITSILVPIRYRGSKNEKS